VEATKILGLLSLRVADSLVLPLNTTQYAIELGYYLDKVLHIAQSTETEGPQLNLSSLGQSIGHLIHTSKALDKDTESQLEELHKILPSPPSKHP
jgi:N-acetylated-alpha-linked acidic dipeptidase